MNKAITPKIIKWSQLEDKHTLKANIINVEIY